MCLIRVIEFGRYAMKFELYYEQLFKNFICSRILFLTPYTRVHTPILRRNAPFHPIPNLFSNLIITILHLLILLKTPSYLLYFLLYSIQFSQTKQDIVDIQVSTHLKLTRKDLCIPNIYISIGLPNYCILSAKN